MLPLGLLIFYPLVKLELKFEKIMILSRLHYSVILSEVCNSRKKLFRKKFGFNSHANCL